MDEAAEESPVPEEEEVKPAENPCPKQTTSAGKIACELTRYFSGELTRRVRWRREPRSWRI